MAMRKWIASGLISVVAMGVLPVSVVLAATPQPSSAPGQGLEISPPVVELSANPGQTVTTNIRIRNVASGTLIAKGKADDFGAGDDESGQPKLLLLETGATRYSLKYWVQGVPDLTLAPQELKTTNVTIKIPMNAEPGGHFGVIRFTAVPPNVEGTGVALSASIGTLVLLRVSGAITDNVSLAEFSASQKGKKSNFFEHGPVDFLVRLKNDGSVHEKVQGNITVTDMFGKKVAAVNVNDKGGNVLPGSIRRFEQQLSNKGLFGHYDAKLNLSYLSGSKKLEATLGFWVIPWKLILLVLLGLVVLGYLLRLAIKRYNAYIIEMARKR